MATVFHYLPYILGAGFAVLALLAILGGGDAKKAAYHRQRKQVYYRWDDRSAHRD